MPNFHSLKLSLFLRAIVGAMVGALLLSSCNALQLVATTEPTAVPPTPTPTPTEVPPTPTPEPTEVPPTPTPEPTEVPPTPTPEPLTILLVAEDSLSGRASFTSSDEIGETLDILGVDFDTWSTHRSGVPTRKAISAYTVVIWAVGDDCCDSPPPDSVEAMIGYLNGGGNLIAEGGSMASPWAGHPFTLDYLGVTVTGYSPIGDIVVEDSDHPLAAGFPEGSISLSVSGLVPPDTIGPGKADAVFVRGPKSAEAGTPAITAHDTGRFKVVFSAVPLQWLSSVDRERLLQNALDWFSSGTGGETGSVT
jgi:hypothetical protein